MKRMIPLFAAAVMAPFFVAPCCAQAVYVAPTPTATSTVKGIVSVPSSGGLSVSGGAVSEQQPITSIGTGLTLSGGALSATGGESGTVTSISGPTGITWANSTTTPTGSWSSETQNYFLAGPASGGSGAATWRAIAAGDLPLASSSAFGAVKVDGTTITASSGVISGYTPQSALAPDSIAANVNTALSPNVVTFTPEWGYASGSTGHTEPAGGQIYRWQVEAGNPAAQSMIVSGAGTASINGTYAYTGGTNTTATWMQIVSPYNVIYYSSNEWHVGSGPMYSTTSFPGNSPAGVAYVLVGGSAPAPTVTAQSVSFVGPDGTSSTYWTGHTLVTGQNSVPPLSYSAYEIIAQCSAALPNAAGSGLSSWTSPVTSSTITYTAPLTATTAAASDTLYWSASTSWTAATNWLNNATNVSLGAIDATSGVAVTNPAVGDSAVTINAITGQTGNDLTIKDPAGNVATKADQSGSISTSGSVTVTALSAPTGGSATVHGTAGNTYWYYTVTALNGNGETTQSSEFSTLTANATLSVSNYVTVAWTAVVGAKGYKIYAGNTTGSEAYLATVSTPTASYNQVANGTPSGSPPTINTTGYVTAPIVNVASHLISSGSSPTVAAGTYCTSPAVTANSTDLDGNITATGTTPGGIGSLFTVTFAAGYSHAPIVTLTAADARSAVGGLWVSSVSATAFTVSSAVAIASADALSINYRVSN